MKKRIILFLIVFFRKFLIVFHKNYLSEWRYKNAEPSDMALTLNRIGGFVIIIIGVIMIFIR